MNIKNTASIGAAAERVFDYVNDNTTYQGEAVKRIESSRYTDPDVWQKEVDLIFKTVPLCLAASAELPTENSYKAMEVMGIPLLITRNSQGSVRVFLNVCSHRASPVAEIGCGIQKRFACKYHGWTYGNDGRLIGVADAAKFGRVEKNTLGLRELPSAERAGLIFAVLNVDGAIDLDAYFNGALGDLDDIDMSSWAYLGERNLTGANWKIAADGYLEGYHFASLHPDTIHPRTPSNVTHYDAYGPHLRIAFPQVDIIEKLADIPRQQWGEMENTGFDFVRILFPNVSVFVAPEITQIAQIFPGPTPDTHTTYLTFLRKAAPVDEDDRQALEDMMDFLLGVVRDEDYTIGALIQKGIESGAHKEIVLGKNERGNQLFHEYIEWYLEDDPNQSKPSL
ncbi:MAG: phenylpropionate dioxygenase-like ring-hydroxylating dioxygenase large terminal subunit [Arenicella sp.]|jgi:phenylpropionate dioxygenase-like ring-hydroxylating dioxygenase large terminal subunit